MTTNGEDRSEMTPERARQILAGATRHNAMLEAQGDMDGHVLLAIEQAAAFLAQHARAEAAEERLRGLAKLAQAAQLAGADYQDLEDIERHMVLPFADQAAHSRAVDQAFTHYHGILQDVARAALSPTQEPS